MIVGFYSGASAIDYNEQKLASVTNNLANMSKNAYKASDFVLRTRKINPRTKLINPLVLKRLPPLYGTQRAGVFKDFSTPGSLKSTENPMDLAIDSSIKNGFYAVKKHVEDSDTYYTRNGQLSIGALDPNNPSGARVLQASGHILLGKDGNPIEVDPLNGALDITPGGSVMQAGEIVGEIPLYRFNKSPDPTEQKDSNLQSLMRLGDSLYKIPPKLQGEFNPIVMSLGDSSSGVLMRQGYEEGSNVNLMEQMMTMIEVQRASQAGQEAMSKQVGSLEKLFQIVRS